MQIPQYSNDYLEEYYRGIPIYIGENRGSKYNLVSDIIGIKKCIACGFPIIDRELDCIEVQPYRSANTLLGTFQIQHVVQVDEIDIAVYAHCPDCGYTVMWFETSLLDVKDFIDTQIEAGILEERVMYE